MKRIFWFLFIAILFACSNGIKSFPNDWEIYGLNGKVKSYTDRVYEAKKRNGVWERHKMMPESIYNTKFNKKGYVLRTKIFNEFEDLMGIEKYHYYKNTKTSKTYSIRKEYGNLKRTLERKSVYKIISKTEIEFENFNYAPFEGTESKSGTGKIALKGNKIVKIINIIYIDTNQNTEKMIQDNNYNNQNELISTYIRNKKSGLDQKFTLEYLEYDSLNNFTKKLRTLSKGNKKENFLIIREIEYY